jgi:hypothetical protein
LFNIEKEVVDECFTISMEDIINAYKLCVVAKLKLSFEDAKKGNIQFFSDVFKNPEAVKHKDILSLNAFGKLVERCISLKRNLNQNKFKSINAFAINLLWETRYVRYYVLPYVFSFFSEEKNEIERDNVSLANSITVYKYLLVNSINFDKTINSVNSFICKEILQKIPSNDTESLASAIYMKIKDSPQIWWKDCENWAFKTFEDKIKSGLYYNRKRAMCVLILSTLLYEIKAKDFDVAEIRNRLFDWSKSPFDLEHVYAKDIFEKENSDKEVYNGIGNLIILERKINRSIGNKTFDEKKESYKKSRYTLVKEIAKNNSWNIDKINAKANDDYEKLKNFIFVEK